MNVSVNTNFIRQLLIIITVVSLSFLWLFVQTNIVKAQTSESGSIGVEGTISSPPPSQGATISLPTNGQTFTNIPVTVSGICPNGLLVKVFKNNVFAGAVDCRNGSYSIVIDLFPGTNELVARVYDALDQPGPDSNTVSVNYADNRQGAASRVTLTSNFAKRGAFPGQELTWPIILSGGIGPYAISVDWGDGSAPDLISQEFPGVINIKHVYDSPGVYNIIVKATDRNGNTAYLQIVGVANGPLGQDNSSGGTAASGGANGEGQPTDATTTKILWQPAALTAPFVVATFWLGKKYEIRTIRKKIERGQRPF
jgi:hypothetical protein